MKTFLASKEELVKVLNLGKYPVLYLNLDNDSHILDEDGSYIKGSLCKIAWDNLNRKDMANKCQLVCENGTYKLLNEPVCLSDRYTAGDFINDIQYARTPILHKNEIVAVAHFSITRNVKFIRLLQVSKRVDVHGIVAATLEEIPNDVHPCR